MRDKNRLDKFYKEICLLHKKYLPDWRFGQLMYNFLVWLNVDKKVDIFFPEEDRLLKLFKEYIANTVQCDLMCGDVDEY